MYTYYQKSSTTRVMARCFDDRATQIMMFINDLIPEKDDGKRPSYDEVADVIHIGAALLKRGEWIIYDHNGQFTIFSDEGFKARYEECL